MSRDAIGKQVISDGSCDQSFRPTEERNLDPLFFGDAFLKASCLSDEDEKGGSDHEKDDDCGRCHGLEWYGAA